MIDDVHRCHIEGYRGKPRETVIVEQCSKPAVGVGGFVKLAHYYLLWHLNDNSHGRPSYLYSDDGCSEQDVEISRKAAVV